MNDLWPVKCYTVWFGIGVHGIICLDSPCELACKIWSLYLKNWLSYCIYQWSRMRWRRKMTSSDLTLTDQLTLELANIIPFAAVEILAILNTILNFSLLFPKWERGRTPLTTRTTSTAVEGGGKDIFTSAWSKVSSRRHVMLKSKKKNKEETSGELRLLALVLSLTVPTRIVDAVE